MVIRKFKHLWQRDKSLDLEDFKALFEKFQQILAGNNHVLEIISEMEDKLSGEYIFDIHYLQETTSLLNEKIHHIIHNLNAITDNRYIELFECEERISHDLKAILAGKSSSAASRFTIPLSEIDADDIEQVGGKNAQIGEVRNRVKLPTPEGFAITTDAYRRFMDYNHLWESLQDLAGKSSPSSEGEIARYDRAVDELFERAQLPPQLEKAIQKSLQNLLKKRRQKGFAVRSSAYGEDEIGQSYAGQFATFLDCAPDEVAKAYTRVLASRFHYSARIYGGRDGGECDVYALPMAVSVQEMIPARVAGVVYTSDPSGEHPDRMSISAVHGSGTAIVSGTKDSDFLQVSRLDPTVILHRRIGKAEPAPDQDTDLIQVEKPLPQPCLSDDQVKQLAETAIILDRYFKRPQDIEWCLDTQGTFYVLQCRPLRITRRRKIEREGLQKRLAQHPVLMKGSGQVAERGIAAGKVWKVKEDDDPLAFPVGAVAVSKYTSPRLTSIIRRAAAIITDVGSSTGHMATIAREFGVPTIVGTGTATERLRNGLEVTVDAEENIIYEGIVEELLEYELEAEDVFRDLREYRILRRLLRRITPLNLIDPNSNDFAARNCRTYHDILRFSHEKAMQELANLNLLSRRFRGVKAQRLDLPIPLGLSVIDLSNETAEISEETIKSPEEICSEPMKAILRGLTAPGAWSTHPVQLGLGDFISSLTRYSATDHSPQYQGQNLAVISPHYVNLSLRLGYHFNVIDAYVSENINDNYIYFRFVGGVTENDRRHRRALALKKILERMHFIVTVKGDLVVSRLKKWDQEELLKILELLGKLIGFTRQLDTQMLNDEAVDIYTEEFFKRFADESH